MHHRAIRIRKFDDKNVSSIKAESHGRLPGFKRHRRETVSLSMEENNAPSPGGGGNSEYSTMMAEPNSVNGVPLREII